jgi:parvulin-like peptidyl-prolyl isomerase
VLLELPEGGVSEPIETSAGWHVVQLVEREEGTVQPFEEVRAECESRLRQERFGEAFQSYMKDLWNESTVEVRARYQDRLPQAWKERAEIRK